MTLDASLRLRVDSTQVKEGELAINKLTFAGKNLDETYKKLGQRTGSKIFQPIVTGASGAADAIKKTEDRTKRFRSVAQQAGFQVQDLAVQLQSGTSAAVAFGQQGSQLAGAFGPTGAIVGAFIAVGAALSGVLIPALGLTGGAVDELVKKVRDGNVELAKLGEAQRQVFEREQLEKIKDTEDEIASYEKRLKAARDQVALLSDAEERRRRIRAAGQTFEVEAADPKQLAKRRQEITNLEATIEGLNNQLAEEKKTLDEVNNSREADIVSRARAAVAVTAEAQALKSLEAVQRSNLTTVQLIQDSARQQITVLANAYSQDLINLEEYQEQRKLIIARANEEIERENQRSSNASNSFLTQSQQNTLGQTGQFFGNLAQIASKGGKDQFDTYKRLAQAQAAISAALAINGILGQTGTLGPAAIPLAFSVGALAAVQIAEIESQEYQPRALGGQMRAGGSYLVGERGPELITMGNRNANITPNNQLGGNTSNNITQVFQISAGVQGTVRQEILAAVPLMKKVASQAVISEARKGGAMSRAVGVR